MWHKCPNICAFLYPPLERKSRKMGLDCYSSSFSLMHLSLCRISWQVIEFKGVGLVYSVTIHVS